MTYPLVMVEWKDINGEATSSSVSGLEGPVTAKSFGLLVRDEPSWISVAGSANYKPDGTLDEVSNVDSIPKGCITLIHTLGETW